MIKKVNCIMLVDDNADDNFIHERVIKKSQAAETVKTQTSALQALEYLKDKANHKDEHPDLIFLDINMPGMNGWEFLEEYGRLEKEFQCRAVVVMLTTSNDPQDKMKAMQLGVPYDFQTKPLTQDMLQQIMQKYC